MNEYLMAHQWDGLGFRDPGLTDTALTATGRRQAAALAPVTRALDPPPQVRPCRCCGI
jgi:broad specificity phosphatase PhoE